LVWPVMKAMANKLRHLEEIVAGYCCPYHPIPTQASPSSPPLSSLPRPPITVYHSCQSSFLIYSIIIIFKRCHPSLTVNLSHIFQPHWLLSGQISLLTCQVTSLEVKPTQVKITTMTNDRSHSSSLLHPPVTATSLPSAIGDLFATYRLFPSTHFRPVIFFTVMV